MNVFQADENAVFDGSFIAIEDIYKKLSCDVFVNIPAVFNSVEWSNYTVVSSLALSAEDIGEMLKSKSIEDRCAAAEVLIYRFVKTAETMRGKPDDEAKAKLRKRDSLFLINTLNRLYNGDIGWCRDGRDFKFDRICISEKPDVERVAAVLLKHTLLVIEAATLTFHRPANSSSAGWELDDILKPVKIALTEGILNNRPETDHLLDTMAEYLLAGTPYGCHLVRQMLADLLINTKFKASHGTSRIAGWMQEVYERNDRYMEKLLKNNPVNLESGEVFTIEAVRSLMSPKGGRKIDKSLISLNLTRLISRENLPDNIARSLAMYAFKPMIEWIPKHPVRGLIYRADQSVKQTTLNA